ncbi:MAG: RNA-binding cell elongation regulator Jag/EloR [Hyphomicrobiales bacterium]
MDQAEASGKTVDDALSRALKQLGASRQDFEAGRVEMIVLDEGRKAFLGVGGRDARVRVQRATGEPEPAANGVPLPDTRILRGQQRGQGRDRQGQRRTQERGQRGNGRNGSQRAGRPSRPSFEQATPKLTEADFLRKPDFSGEPAAEPVSPGAGSAGRERGRGRRGRGGAEHHEQRAEQAERPRRREREEEPHIEPDINAEEVDFSAQTVDDLLRILDINAELTIREPLTPGDGLGMVRAVIDIQGDDLGLLIGRRGDTLLSLQYLVNLIVSRRYPGKGGVSIDVEHYRHRRESQIVSLAQRMADRVRQTGSAITLEPMTASERRLVHLALADDPDLVTNSIGEGDNRKVVISSRR